MELSFSSRELRDYWLDPSEGRFSADEISAAKQGLEDLASAENVSDIVGLYDIELESDYFSFDPGGAIALRCFVMVAPPGGRTGGGSDDGYSHATRIQIVSIERNDPAS